MNILVTGGAGYIGSYLVPILVEQGHNVAVVDDLSNSEPNLPAKVQFLDCDIDNFEERTGDCDVVIHLAGRIEVGADPHTLWWTNVQKPIRMLQHLRAKKVIVASSAAIYGEGFPRGILESDPLTPSSVYGRTKVALEQLVTDICGSAKEEVTILRLFNVAGGRECHKHETHLLPLALRSSPEQPLILHGDALAMTRDFVHVEDVAHAFVAAIDGPLGIYNIGTGRGTPVVELLALAAEFTSIHHQRGPARAGDPSRLVANIDRAHKMLNWRPQHDLESIVRSAWEAEKVTTPK